MIAAIICISFAAIFALTLIIYAAIRNGGSDDIDPYNGDGF